MSKTMQESHPAFGHSEYDESTFDAVTKKYGIAEKQVYSGGIHTADYEFNKKVSGEFIEKVLTTTNEYASSTSYSSTSGNLPTLIPIWPYPEIINLSQRATPLYAMLPRLAVRSKFFDQNKGQFKSTNASFKFEDAAQADYDDEYNRTVTAMKYAYAVGRVSGQSQLFTRGYLNMEKQEVMMKTRALVQLLENKIINGVISDDAAEFDGLNQLVSTNATDISGDVTLENLRLHILYTKQGAKTFNAIYGGGVADLIVTDFQTINDVKVLLTPFLGYRDQTANIAWGIQTITFEGIPMLGSAFISTTSGSKELYILDTSVVNLGVALDITMERLAKTDDSNKFMLKWYGALLVLNERWCARMYNLS